MADFKDILRDFGLAHWNRYYSIYEGTVANNEDPEFSGRIKLKCPKVYGDQTYDKWSIPRGMFCGNGIGLFAIPNVGDVVWVSFLEGDPRFPIWEYGWFGRGDVTANIKNNGNKPTNTVWQTKSGHRIELDDKVTQEAVRVYSKDGFGLEININGVSVITPTGKNIFLGGLNSAAEPAVLGNKNETALNDIKVILTSIKTLLQTVGSADSLVASGLGLSYGATFTAAATALGTALTTLGTAIPATKSTKVKLD